MDTNGALISFIIGFIMGGLFVFAYTLDHKQSGVIPQPKNYVVGDLSTLESSIDHPDTIIGYWQGGVLFLKFNNHTQDTVDEDNK